MGSRRKAREFTLQLLYQQDLRQITPEEILEVFWATNRARRENQQFAESLFTQTLKNRPQIDDLIRCHAQHWRLERMAVVDRNILRMAVAEFLFGETPSTVVIDEAIEIARRFSTQESTQFVNGVLDAIREELEPTVGEEEHG